MKYKFLLVSSVFIVIGGVMIWNYNFLPSNFFGSADTVAVAAIVKSPFLYTFQVDGILHEAGSMNDSSSPYWWLNSGGIFSLENGMGKTIRGELAPLNKWRVLYSKSNPVDTDNGYHPQNIFRLVTRSTWQNVGQEVYFNIAKLNMSASSSRDASNGVLLFNRYVDSDNLYYTGIRADGAAVIKKKKQGTYYTLSHKPFYRADAPYNRDTNPNLIPGKKWIGLRSEVTTNPDNTVSIKLFIDKEKTGIWTLAAEAVDDGKTYGGAPILPAGYAGIRTDFMDASFDDFKLTKLF